jgi:hypothetical protein
VSESGRAIKIAADCLLVKEKLKETPIHLFNGNQKISTLDITYLTGESK